MKSPDVHQSHPDIINRLRRVEGHLRSVLEMLEAGRSCVDVAQQMHAIEKGIASAKRIFINDHIDHCLQDSGSSAQSNAQIVTELKQISKFF